MVARNAGARKRPRPEKRPRVKAPKRQVERRREVGICLARQAGPGPRM
jgi:hypothetical protein